MLPLYELIDAIKRNNVDEAKDALEKGADPNGKDFGRISMLQLTEKYHANNLVSLLVRFGADLFECLGPKKESLLHIAARNENVGFACALLDAGLTPNLRNKQGDTPLHLAAATGQTYLARYLIDHKADSLIQNKQSKTPLAMAVGANQSELVRLLEPIESIARQLSTYQEHGQTETRSVPIEQVTIETQAGNNDHGLVAENSAASSHCSWTQRTLSKDHSQSVGHISIS